MQANIGAIVADTFEPHKRGRAFGFTGLGWNFGSMLGIVLGGFITAFVGWRYIFYINIPIGIIAVFFGLKYIKDENKRPAKLDLPGMALLTVALFSATYGAINIAGIGLNPSDLMLIAVGAALIVVFLLYEKRAKDPMVNLDAFRKRVLTFSLFASFFQSIGYLSVAFIVIMYLQGVRGMNPFTASLLLVPGYLLSSFVSPRAGRLSDKYGAKVIATAGLLLMMLTIAIYLSLTATTSLYVIVVATIFSGIGAAMFFPANSSAIMANADPQHYGSISGLSRLMQNIGTLSSFVVTITVASLSIPRPLAFQIFIGTSKLVGGISAEFLQGIHSAFIVSLVLLAIAVALSYTRGSEERTKAFAAEQWEKNGKAPAPEHRRGAEGGARAQP